MARKDSWIKITNDLVQNLEEINEHPYKPSKKLKLMSSYLRDAQMRRTSLLKAESEKEEAVAHG
jgi:hypothetical protein